MYLFYSLKSPFFSNSRAFSPALWNPSMPHAIRFSLIPLKNSSFVVLYHTTKSRESYGNITAFQTFQAFFSR